MGEIICIANQKGGVGKTTTAVNLAASLAVSGERTLLVDLDPQSNASSGLGVTVAESEASVYDVLVGGRPAGEAIRALELGNLDLLPAQRDLVGAEVELVSAIGREFRLAEALHAVRDRYRLVLIDCPPSLGLLTINGLTAADRVLVPLQCEYYALEGISALMETVELIRQRLHPGLALCGVLLTMFDTRNALSHQVAGEVRRHFGDRVFRTVIPRNVRLSEAPSHGVPAILYDPASRGSQAYVDLAGELLQRLRAEGGAHEPLCRTASTEGDPEWK